ncbi:MAG: hypothetical protein KatS3mg031_0542 [Chitinophagales bacterium]|nr:MAG: hypothetical protein KatS3mg031_0542 [Chitinophagales bacterium]
MSSISCRLCFNTLLQGKTQNIQNNLTKSKLSLALSHSHEDFSRMKLLHRILLQACAMLLVPSGMYAQDYLHGNEYYFSFTNRMNLLIVEDSTSENITAGIVFSIGSSTEGELFQGMSSLYEIILKKKLREFFIQQGVLSDTTPVVVSSYTFLDGMYFYFTLTPGSLQQALKAIYKSITAPVTSEELAAAARESTELYLKLRQDPVFRMDDQIMAFLWADNYKKRVAVKQWNDSLIALLAQRFVKMRNTYLCPRNCLMILLGPLKARAVSELVKKQFINWEKCEMNPFTHFPAPNYRTTLNSMQLIEVSPEIRQPFFRIAFPGPNTYEDLKGNYCALVLSSILTHPASQLYRYLRDSCRITSVKLENELGKYINQLTFTVAMDSLHLSEGYSCFRQFLFALDTLLSDTTDLHAGKQLLIESYQQMKNDPFQQVDLIGRYWTSISLNSYSTFEDSIATISLADLRHFIRQYFFKRSYVAALAISPELRASSRIDSIFTPTHADITDYHIFFKKNSASPESQRDDTTLLSLIQFLHINPTLRIKVNGIAHKDELLQVRDPQMSAWLSSLGGTFIINPPSILAKKRFRLDVYRSLTVMKRLTESGIEIHRLFGTGQLNRSTEGGREHYKVYCTRIVNY